jgi:protein-S-isoprenylcysteine O-methyltransferase Ste14
VAAQFAVQLWRMHEEEKVLEAQFPEYSEYRARTARLVPGVY